MIKKDVSFIDYRMFLSLARNSDSVHCLQNKHTKSALLSNARTTSPRELGLTFIDPLGSLSL